MLVITVYCHRFKRIESIFRDCTDSSVIWQHFSDYSMINISVDYRDYILSKKFNNPRYEIIVELSIDI